MFVYGWAKGVDDERCAVNPDHPDRMLCGRLVGFVPVVSSPFTPSDLHDVCRDAIFRDGPQTEQVPAEPIDGVCPVCGGTVPLERGRIDRHGVVVMSGGVPAESGRPCEGVGQQPEVEE
jgi:hypothetical protein